MEKTMKLTAMTAVKEREYPDKQTGEVKKVHWVELSLTDGLDSMVAEMVVPGQRGADGQMTYPQPQLEVERIYRVAAELVGTTGNKDGRDWYMNRVNIRKIARL